MLNHQPWVHTAPDMITEWEQCYDEGHDVAAFREMCETVSRSGYAWDDTAKKITDQMKNAPIRADYTFCEPSDLKEILADYGACRDFVTDVLCVVFNRDLNIVFIGEAGL